MECDVTRQGESLGEEGHSVSFLLLLPHLLITGMSPFETQKGEPGDR